MTTLRGSRLTLALVLLWAATRALLFVAGTQGVESLGPGREAQRGNLQRPWTGPPALEMWARWDSEWYLLIAEEGYHLEGHLDRARVAYGPADATGFFPLYPALVRGAALVLERVPGLDRIRMDGATDRRSPAPPGRRAAILLAAILVSNGALLGVTLLLARHVLETSTPGERSVLEGATPARAALLTCAALLLFPSSLFLSAAYPESLLLLLALLVFRYLREGRWWRAGLAGALASAAKPSGILLILPAIFFLWRAGRSLKERGPGPGRWLSLPLYASGLALFCLYCSREFGDPISWVHRQVRWRGALSGPWRAFTRWLEEPTIHGAHGSSVELILALLALLLLVLALRKRPPAESAYSAAVILPPLGSTLWSFGRLSMQAFPLFIVLGRWAARRPLLSLLYFLPASAGTGILMAYYAAGWWAG